MCRYYLIISENILILPFFSFVKIMTFLETLKTSRLITIQNKLLCKQERRQEINDIIFHSQQMHIKISLSTNTQTEWIEAAHNQICWAGFTVGWTFLTGCNQKSVGSRNLFHLLFLTFFSFTSMNASDVKEEGRRICEDVGSESCTESLSDWCYDCSDVDTVLVRMVKRELSVKAEFSVYWPIYVPTFTYGDELWIVTKRTKLRIKAATMSFLRRLAGLSVRDGVRSSAIREKLIAYSRL